MDLEIKEMILKEREDHEIMSYFNDICIGDEYNMAKPVTRKFKSNARIYVVNSNLFGEQMQFIDSVLVEFNKLPTDGFKMELTNDSASASVHVYIMSVERAKRVEGFKNLTSESFGHFTVNAKGNNTYITDSQVFIAETEPLIKQKVLLMQELMNAVGLLYVSPLYVKSIFYEFKHQSKFNTLQFSEQDKKIISLLYHPKMKAGLNKLKTVKVMREIMN
ncbi:DUF2927 domain-containing protein [Pedobacter faecalis]|uniref:DUF2927 domain-containing protein n=1 Tax=Pedobacter faecalis TaxID=3041495 RepID=UPI00254FCCEB|nr:DUF2927 domain-containing protein [Pedobacter sp. ELA7]